MKERTSLLLIQIRKITSVTFREVENDLLHLKGSDQSEKAVFGVGAPQSFSKNSEFPLVPYVGVLG